MSAWASKKSTLAAVAAVSKPVVSVPATTKESSLEDEDTDTFKLDDTSIFTAAMESAKETAVDSASHTLSSASPLSSTPLSTATTTKTACIGTTIEDTKESWPMSSKAKSADSSKAKSEGIAAESKSRVTLATRGKHTTANRVVLDSGVFIARQNVVDHFEAVATQYFITSGVVKEVCDARSKEYMDSFPFRLAVKSPRKESVEFVSKWLGHWPEYRQLSATDRGLVAVCYELEVDTHGSERIRDAKTLKLQLLEAQRTAKAKQQTEESAKAKRGKKKRKRKKVSAWDAWAGEWASPDNYSSTAGPPKDPWTKPVSAKLREVTDTRTLTSELTAVATDVTDATDTKVAEHSTSIDSVATVDTADVSEDLVGKKKAESKVSESLVASALSGESLSSVVCVTLDLRMQQLMLDMGLRVMSVSPQRLSKMKESATRGYKDGEVLLSEHILCGVCGHKYADVNLRRVFCTANCGADDMILEKRYLQRSGRVRFYRRKVHSKRAEKAREAKLRYDERQRKKVFGKKKKKSGARGVAVGKKPTRHLETREKISQEYYKKRVLS